jgi:sugar/nucleoside kinase (ribokinase family)
MSLLTIGTMAFDDVETPFGKAEKIVGGACTYISYAASYFINEINLSAVIGGDFPSSELENLEQRGVNLEGLEIKEDEKSFYWSGKYHLNMNSRDTLATELNVLANFNPILPESYKSSEYVMLGNLTPSIQYNVIEQLDGSQQLIAMDTMNFWMDIAMDELLLVIAKVDLLIINDEEARQLSGQHSLVKAADVIKGMGVKYLIIKKGEHGALLFYDTHIFFAPALPLAEVFDPTGAGDTFAGGVMGYLAKTKDHSYANFKRSIIYGSAMASFCVEKFGVERLKELDIEMIYSRVKEFSELVKFEI